MRLPFPVHCGDFDGTRKTRARRLEAAVDLAGIAGLIVTAILAVLVGWPS